MKETIEKIYSESKIENIYDDSLVDCYNQILDKTPDELSVYEIGFLLRQKMIIDLAIPRAIEELKKDPHCGYYFEGDLLSSLAEYGEIPDKYKEPILLLIPVLENFAKTYEFELEKFKTDYLNWIDELKNNVS